MSWQFDNAPPLAVSIETRKRKGQEYSAVKGFFKQYEIIYVVADEQDVVGLRTNHRGEHVYLYRLKSTPALARAMLHGLRRQHQRPGRTTAVLQRARRQLHDDASVATGSTWIRTHRRSTGASSPTATWTGACTTEASSTRACPSKSFAG